MTKGEDDHFWENIVPKASHKDLTWCEVSVQILEQNILALRRYLPSTTLLAPAVKSNAYGHGFLMTAQAFLRGGANWLCVHTLAEAKQLREAQIDCPIYLFGPTQKEDLEEAILLKLDLVLYQVGHLKKLLALAQQNYPHLADLKLHLKLETGNHRQGIPLEEALVFTQQLKEYSDRLNLVGVSSHFANIEDTTDHHFAETQLKKLEEAAEQIELIWGKPLLKHIANSAASLLWPNRIHDLARIGIAAYGLWPSEEVQQHCHDRLTPTLKPALSWRTKIAQVKDVPAQQPIGYGCTYITQRPTRLAILPLGYYEGYDRGLSNRGVVLIHGQRAPILGRVCMNITMVDVTDIEQHTLVQEGDVATLLGQDGKEEITANDLAEWSNTINYEIVARIAGHLPRYDMIS